MYKRQVTNKLDNGLLDFGMIIEPADKQKYNYIKLPETEVSGVLMPKTSFLADKEYIKPEDLINYPLIISRQTSDSNEIAGWFGKDIEDLNIIGTYNLLYNASIMVQEGIGYAICIDKLIDTSENSELCFRPLSPTLESGLNLIWKKHQTFSKASKAFLKQLREDLNL